MYPTDYEAKTSHLTIAEDGAYFRLIRLCWMTPGCTLPNDEAWILRRARARTDEEIEAVCAVLDEFFTVQEGRLVNSRLLEEWAAANERHERRKNAGSKGGSAKALKINKTAPSNAVAKPKQPEPEPEPDIDTNVSIKMDFDFFWEICPRKVGKGEARKAFEKALKKASFREICEGMCRYAQSRAGKDPKFTKHPGPWLNAERWTDEIQEEQDATLALTDRIAARFGEVDSGPGNDALRALGKGGPLIAIDGGRDG